MMKNDTPLQIGRHDLPSAYWERVKEVRQAQNFKEFYSHYFSRHFSAFITAALSYTSVTPNQVTLSMIFWGVFGGALFCKGEPIGYLIGGLSLVLLNIADAVDGELARYTGATSRGGDYLDRLAHYVTNSAAILGMGVGLFLQYAALELLLLAIIIEIVYTFDEVARDLLITCALVEVHGNGGRKEAKQETRALSSPLFNRLSQVVGTNLAFFHLIALCGLVDWLLVSSGAMPVDATGASLSYFGFFSLITLLKAASRSFKIRSLYFS